MRRISTTSNRKRSGALAREALALFGLLLIGCAEKTATTPELEPPPPDTSPRVVLVIVDGLRYSEGLGDATATHAPRMHQLAAVGTKIEPFQNDQATYTAAAVPAIWTGSWTPTESISDAACGGDDNIAAAQPTVFEYFRKATGAPDTKCQYLVGGVSCPWRASLDSDYGPAYWPRYDTRGSSDLARWDVAQLVLDQAKPDLLVFYLPDVDGAGHSGDWDAYLQAIAVADSVVGELWTTLQGDPYYADRTTLLVTNDHGRHDDRAGEPHGGFSGHGDGCHGCRTIELLAVGPQVRRGFVSSTPRTIPDIVPTIGSILGFATPEVSGEAMVEILDR